ncbi:MAG TPA: hypothetical protein VF339_14200 [Gammaproteobacteria bacterium]
MSQGSMVIKDGVRVVQGTPDAPLKGPALFLRIRRVADSGRPPRMTASLATARPGPAGYVIKDLIDDMELGPKEALEKAIAIAKRGGVAEIYVNADLSKLPGRIAASG